MNTRKEKLIDEIENTEKEINKYQLVIQQLETIKTNSNDEDIKNNINELINNFDNQVKFLEDIKDSDEQYLNLNL